MDPKNNRGEIPRQQSQKIIKKSWRSLGLYGENGFFPAQE
jgi:hypothetical protein